MSTVHLRKIMVVGMSRTYCGKSAWSQNKVEKTTCKTCLKAKEVQVHKDYEGLCKAAENTGNEELLEKLDEYHPPFINHFIVNVEKNEVT